MFAVVHKSDNEIIDSSIAATIEGAQFIGCKMILDLYMSYNGWGNDFLKIIKLIQENKLQEALNDFNGGGDEIVIQEVNYFTETELSNQLQDKLKELDVKEIIE